MNYEVDSGNYLNIEDSSHKTGDDQTVSFDIYKLKVTGGFIYYRDVLLWDKDKITKISQTSTFVKS